jgi:hypothetical protein
MAAICLDTGEHESLVFRRQELALLGKWGNKGPADDADDNGCATLNDEDPGMR